MGKVTVTANGDVALPPDTSTRSNEVGIYIPAVIGTATITIGWVDPAGTTVAYADGVMVAGEAKAFACNKGIEMVATIASYSADFVIMYAD